MQPWSSGLHGGRRPPRLRVLPPTQNVTIINGTNNGRSPVKGEGPPQLLVERRQEREEERQLKGNESAVTAKEVAQRRPAGQAGERKQDAAGQPQTPRLDANTQQQVQQRQSDPPRQDAARQRATDQGHQKTDAEAQADKQAKDAQQVRDQKPIRCRPISRRIQQHAKQASDAQAGKGAKDAQQAAKDGGKNKGKKNPKPSPASPPAAQKP